MRGEPFDILVVEDSPTQRLGLASILAEAGYEPRLAGDGLEALRMFEDAVPKLVISDVVMPSMDGYELCRRIKERHPGLPVILLTSLKDPRDIVRGLECGADNYIAKPYDGDRLLHRVDYMRINLEIRSATSAEAGVEIYFAGKRRFLTSSRLQIVDHLLASYEDAVHQTSELREANHSLLQMQSTLEQKNQELERRNEELAALDRQKNELLGTVSHDLRNPLGVIASYMDLLRRGIVPAGEVERTLARVADRAQFALRMTDSLLDTSAIESGSVTLQLQWTAVAQVLTDSVNNNAVVASSSGRALKCVGDDLTSEVLIDTARFEQVLNNLIENGLRFSPDDGEVRIVAKHTGGSGLTIAVEDDGPGVKPEEAERLFRPFERSDTTRAPGRTAGLGLAIAQRVVAGHGCSISVGNSSSGGASFEIRFPPELVRATSIPDGGAQ